MSYLSLIELRVNERMNFIRNPHQKTFSKHCVFCTSKMIDFKSECKIKHCLKYLIRIIIVLVKLEIALKQSIEYDCIAINLFNGALLT